MALYVFGILSFVHTQNKQYWDKLVIFFFFLTYLKTQSQEITCTPLFFNLLFWSILPKPIVETNSEQKKSDCTSLKNQNWSENDPFKRKGVM